MKNFLLSISAILVFSVPSFATVTVSAPAAGATVASPVHYVASATTSTCSKGVASMGIYVNNKLIYVVNATTLNTSISMATGAEHTVVEEWDKCGGATYTTIDLTVTSSSPAAPTVSITAPRTR
jgi:phospholipase C